MLTSNYYSVLEQVYETRDSLSNDSMNRSSGSSGRSTFSSGSKDDLEENTQKNDIEKNYFFLREPKALSAGFSLSLECVEKIIDAVDTVMTLYIIFGFERPRASRWFQDNTGKHLRGQRIKAISANKVRSHTIDLVCEVCQLNGETAWASLFKWKFAAFFAFYREQDIPPFPPLKLPSHGRSFFKAQVMLPLAGFRYSEYLRNHDNLRFMQFTNSTQQLKKGMPTVPQAMVEESIDKTVKKLTTQPLEPVDEFFDVPEVVVYGPENRLFGYKKFGLSKKMIVEQLRRTTREMLGAESIEDHLFEPFFPSTSANYINSRGDGGSLDSLYELGVFGGRDSGISFGTEGVYVSGKRSTHYGSVGRWDDGVRSMYRNLGYECPKYKAIMTFDPCILREEWREQYLSIFRAAVDEKPMVKPVGLCEPLKVRVISKGPPLTYTSLVPLQKWMWSSLKKHKVFALIGRMVTEEDVQRCLGGMLSGDEAVSGDYKASTDNLHSWVSEAIAEEIFAILVENMSKEFYLDLPRYFLRDLKILFIRALTRHIFEGADGEFFTQKEGQLMGSIISFPILCIANAALCRFALELANGETYRLTDKGRDKLAPLLINGDDCLLRGRRDVLRKYWEKICAFAGLESSVGKTYFSDSFCTINSTIFELEGWSWKERKTINMGLLLGRAKDGTRTKIGDLGSGCRKLKETCPPESWLKVKKEFIKRNKTTLSAKAELGSEASIPWFLPEWCGGIGLPIDQSSELSRVDHYCAAFIKKSMNKNRKYKPVKLAEAKTWKMHDRVQGDLESQFSKELCKESTYQFANCHGKIFDLEESYSQAYRYMTIDLLRTKPLTSIKEDVSEEDSVRAALRNNSRMFAKVRQTMANENVERFIATLPIEELEHEVKKTYPLIVQFSEPFSSNEPWMEYPGLAELMGVA
nr:RNA-dependent RNA polymerase [Flumine narna-like virus 59]